MKVNIDGMDAEDAEVRQEGELFTTKGARKNGMNPKGRKGMKGAAASCATI